MLYLLKQVSLLTWYLSAQPCYCCCTYWSRVHIAARYYVNASYDTVMYIYIDISLSLSDTSAVLLSLNLDELLLQRGLKRFPRMLGVYTGASLRSTPVGCSSFRFRGFRRNSEKALKICTPYPKPNPQSLNFESMSRQRDLRRSRTDVQSFTLLFNPVWAC